MIQQIRDTEQLPDPERKPTPPMTPQTFTPAEIEARSGRLRNCACGGEWDQFPHTLCHDCETAVMLRQGAAALARETAKEEEIGRLRAVAAMSVAMQAEVDRLKGELAEAHQAVRAANGLRDAAESALTAERAKGQVLREEVANIRAMEEQTARAYNAVRIHAGTLLAKLDECQPHIDDAFAFKAIHGIRYNGPNYGVALTVLKQTLGLTPPTPTEQP